MAIKDKPATDDRVRTALAIALWHLDTKTGIPNEGKARQAAFKAVLPSLSPRVGRLLRLLDDQNIKLVSK